MENEECRMQNGEYLLRSQMLPILHSALTILHSSFFILQHLGGKTGTMRVAA